MARRKTEGARPKEDIIAVRELDLDGSRRKAKVILWAPRQIGEEEWICRYRVPGMRTPRRSRGCDAFQALIHAMDEIRHALSGGPSSYSAFGLGPGEHGFPLLMLYGLGDTGFSARLEQLVDREITAFLRDGIRASEAHAARKAAEAADGA